ncbi:MAG: HPP family protein [Deltaproteobacteria bacterium]|nr:HPP family protein [Deltaproteobacteria bacterium]MBT4266563.1 HPP family protein [Deltaproteobacteria bacterium]MBT4639044.1 HPP family protein [Deltaproteobacteria bacterium]MBT6500276.1 HPP family protein [Deltaproteobacteria bacterium]MBT6611227.1 HPP family protein [Deltaproteobacteria bacterium]
MTVFLIKRLGSHLKHFLQSGLTAGPLPRYPVIGSGKNHNLGYLYVIVPAGVSAVIMLIVALLINNLSRNRKYPDFWM